MAAILATEIGKRIDVGEIQDLQELENGIREMLKGVGVFYIWKEILILLVMLFGFIMISVRKFQVRLE